MNPFYFGVGARALFGAYHPPADRGGPEGSGVVLCYPVGVEYMRAHRAFRQLTTLLTRAGSHVLRFDYFGTGDSAGDWAEASVEQWTSDVGSAIQELRDTTGIDQVTLVGLRLGGALAARAARGRGDVRRLVLWDPVVWGEEYLAELLRTPGTARFPEGREMIGVRGYPFTRELFEGIRTIRLDEEVAGSGAPVALVISHEDSAFDRLERALRTSGREVGVELVPSDGNWGEGDEFGSVHLPEGIIQRVVERVGSGEMV